MKEDAIVRRGAGGRIICAIEISSCRDVDIPSEYTVDDFIEGVNSAYDDAKERGVEIRINSKKVSLKGYIEEVLSQADFESANEKAIEYLKEINRN